MGISSWKLSFLDFSISPAEVKAKDLGRIWGGRLLLRKDFGNLLMKMAKISDAVPCSEVERFLVASFSGFHEFGPFCSLLNAIYFAND